MESEIEEKCLIEKDSATLDAQTPEREEPLEENVAFLMQKDANDRSEKVTLLSLSKINSDKESSYKTFEEGKNTESNKGLDKHIPNLKLSASNVDQLSSNSEQLSATDVKKERKISNRTDLHLDIKAATKHNSKQFPSDVIKVLPQSATGTPKPMKIAVFLKEGDNRMLQLDKGKITTAGEVKNMMFDVLSISKSAYNVFSIWFISPHLEIQLKRHHIPFLLRKQWPDILMQLSTCQTREEAERDEPVLVFQRNSFCSVESEKEFTDETVMKRLFEEAQYNILNAIYRIPTADAEMLGAMLVRIQYGPYQSNIHRPGYFRKKLSKYLPYYAIGSNKIIQQFRSSKTELRLLQQYEHISNKVTDVNSCQKMFLEYCQSLPFYGSALFKGNIFHKGAKWKLWGSYEKCVTVAINRLGITLMRDGGENIHLPFDHISWEYLKSGVEGAAEGDTDVLCLEYDSLDENAEPVAEQIQIISKQACMMDTMVDSCVNYMNVMNIPITPTCLDYKKLGDISFSTMPSKKHNFTLTRPFKR